MPEFKFYMIDSSDVSSNSFNVSLTADAFGQVIAVNDDDSIFSFNDSNQTVNTTFNGQTLSGNINTNFPLEVYQSGNSGALGNIYEVRVDSTVVGYVADFELVPGTTYNRTPNSRFNSVAYGDLYVCFTTGTMILTDRGEVAVENLKAGDMVETKDEGLQEIRWIGSNRLSADTLAAAPELRPIRIKAGALGNGTPVADLVVSPHHRVLVRSAIAQRLFGAEEVLVAAKQLLLLDGIDVADDMAVVEYFHFLFDDHQVVISNGAETESLYTGPQALKSVGPAALEEIFTIFPELRDREEGFRPEGARTLLSGRQGRKLAQRHAQKGRALVS